MGELRSAARIYVGAVLAAGVALALGSVGARPLAAEDALAAVVLAIAAALAQMLRKVASSKQAFAVTPAFVFAGVLLLPSELLAPVIAVTFVPEWIRFRRNPLVMLFNVGNVLVDAYSAKLAAAAIGLNSPGDLLTVHGGIAALIAVAVFIGLNRLLIAMVLRLARGCSWRQTGLFDVDPFVTDTSVASVGILLALVWAVQPALAILVLFPIYLMHRALEEPSLREMTRTDPKTGLYNSRHFEQSLESELARAKRFGHALSVAMIDLDLLRVVNNTYGHLAGDAVIRGIAHHIRGNLREYDVAARFGGEEFALLLPGCTSEAALGVCERIRRFVAESEYPIPTSPSPIKATISIGIATYPQDGLDATHLLHLADQAVYMAKARGRNRVGAWTTDDTDTKTVATNSPSVGVEPPSRLVSLDADAWHQAGLPRFTMSRVSIDPVE